MKAASLKNTKYKRYILVYADGNDAGKMVEYSDQNDGDHHFTRLSLNGLLDLLEEQFDTCYSNFLKCMQSDGQFTWDDINYQILVEHVEVHDFDNDDQAHLGRLIQEAKEDFPD